MRISKENKNANTLIQKVECLITIFQQLKLKIKTKWFQCINSKSKLILTKHFSHKVICFKLSYEICIGHGQD